MGLALARIDIGPGISVSAIALAGCVAQQFDLMESFA